MDSTSWTFNWNQIESNEFESKFSKLIFRLIFASQTNSQIMKIFEKPNDAQRNCLGPDSWKKWLVAGRETKTYLTVLELKQGFWQLTLDRPSSELPTSLAPFGRYWWNRAPSGINNAPEMCMKGMVQIFWRYFECRMIFPWQEAEAWKKNAIEYWKGFLERARDNEVKFNNGKCSGDS